MKRSEQGKKPSKRKSVEPALPAGAVVTIGEFASGGDGVAELSSGERLFVAGAFPGDAVSVERVRRVAGKNFARVREVRKSGPLRREAPCTYADKCGGCAWMAMNDEAQLQQKQQRVLRHLGRHCDAQALLTLTAGDRLHYRQRARLSFKVTTHETLVGYKQTGASMLVDVPECLVLSAPLQSALTLARTLVGNLVNEGEIVLGANQSRPVLVVRSEAVQPEALYRQCEELVSSGSCAGIAIESHGARAAFGDTRESCIGADGQNVFNPAGGFSQAHESLSPTMASFACAAAAEFERGHVLELHAGAGNLGVQLARDFKRYTSVELSADAVVAAKANFADRKLSGDLQTRDASEFTAAKYDVIVLDPPRTGAELEVQRIAALRFKPKGIVYVSCDPSTLDRDLSILCSAGYGVRTLRAFDLFPQTPHVETVVVLELLSEKL